MLQTFIDSLEDSLNQGTLKPSRYLEKNFKNPRDAQARWSFKDHEYQIAIIDCDAKELSCQKCAQAGVTVLFIRAGLTFCILKEAVKLAYVLPTAKLVQEFVPTRLDTAIESCEYLHKIVGKTTTGGRSIDNSTAKRINNSFFVMRGTTGDTAAISIDLDALFVDELNFCNQDILETLASRLQHSILKVERRFSTPTIPKFGISAEIEQSSGARYAVKCEHCGGWQIPEFFRDAVIPGYGKELREYRAEDSSYPGVKRAYMRCPNCLHNLDRSLLDASRREWVHAFPDREHKGFYVKPFDVPAYNSLYDVLTSIKKYRKRYGRWVNDRLGESYISEENGFSSVAVDAGAFEIPYGASTPIKSRLLQGVFIGADLGKNCHVVIGVPGYSDSGKPALKIMGYTQVDVRGLPDKSMGKYLVDLFKALSGIRMVIDAAPNYETALYAVEQLYHKQAYGCYFGNVGVMDTFVFDNNKGTVRAERDKVIEETVRLVNKGTVLIGKDKDYTVMKEHLDSIKLNEPTGKWVSIGEDHYALALTYTVMAWLSCGGLGGNEGGGMIIDVRGVKLR